MKKTIVILSVLFLTSCSAKLLRPTQSDADRGAAKFPGLTVTELNEGRAMFKHKCTQCHPAKNPSSREEDEWRKIVPQMAAKAMKKKNKKKISDADQEIILKYLITMSEAHKK
jgi:hypothetical protein